MTEIDQGVYICPNIGRAYSHRRAKYFGAYAAKEVADIFEVKAIVVVEKGLGEGKIKWNNSGVKADVLITEAKTKLQMWQWRVDENKSVPLQVFLLDKRAKTKFIKATSGGMLSSKKYFWDIATDCKTSKELADKLRDKNWSDYN